jgi:hypothetical protein
MEKATGAVLMELLRRSDKCRKKALQVNVDLRVLSANKGNETLILMMLHYN